MQGKQLLFKNVRALKVALLSACDRLELVVYPNAEGVKEAARAGDDWPGLQRGFVYFHGEVEVREWVGAFKGVPAQEFAFFFRKGVVVFHSPVTKKAIDVVFLGGNGVRIKVLVSVRI